MNPGREDGSSSGAWRYDLLAVALVLAGLAGALILGALSDGVYMDDDITHYHFARDSWNDVTALLHRWARPGYNLPTAVVAHVWGFEGCRVFSAFQTAVVAALAYLLARRLLGPGLYSALTPLLLWIQPMPFRLAMTTLTETSAAMYLTAGLWLYLRGNRIWGCGAVSLALVTREELMALAPILAVAVILDGLRETKGDWGEMLSTGWVWMCAVATAWAPAAYWTAAWLLDLPADASPLVVFARSYSQEYGAGPWQWFVAVWPEAAGLGVLALAAGGAVRLGRRAWLLTAWTVGLVALHSILFARGLFASGGYSRFLVPVAGLLAVLAAGGLKALLGAGNRRTTVLVLVSAAVWLALMGWTFGYLIPAGYLFIPAALLAAWAFLAFVAKDETSTKWLARLTAAVLLAAGVAHFAVVTRPLRLADSPIHRLLISAVEFIRQNDYANRPGMTQHTLVRFFYPEYRALFSNDDAIRMWREAKAGSLFVWESKYCLKPHEPRSTQLLQDELARLGRKVFEKSCNGDRVIVYERIETGGATGKP